MAVATTNSGTLTGSPAALFQLTTVASAFWDGPPHGETLQALRQAVRENRGVLLLTGAAGCGKTMLVNALAETLRGEGAIVGALSHPQVDALELLRAIADSFGLTTAFDNRAAFLSILREFIDDARGANRSVLFIIDEAQSLSPEAMAEIAGLRVGDRDGAHGLNLLLAGQERLQVMLRAPEHAELARAIAVTCRLDPLTEDGVAQYVRDQLRKAGVEQPAFEVAALREIAEAAGGNARLVNALCSLALAAAGRQGVQVIRPRLVRQCAVDLSSGSHTNWAAARPPRDRATASSRSTHAKARRYAPGLVMAGAAAVAAASFAVTVYVVMAPSVDTGRPEAVGAVGQPERRLVPSEPRAAAVPPDVTPVEPVPPGVPRGPVASGAVPSEAPPTPAPIPEPVGGRPSPIPPSAGATRPAPVAKAFVSPPTTAPGPTESPAIMTPRETRAAPAPPAAGAVTARPESQSSEPDPGAIIDWMLTNAPVRRTAFPDPIPIDR